MILHCANNVFASGQRILSSADQGSDLAPLCAAGAVFTGGAAWVV